MSGSSLAEKFCAPMEMSFEYLVELIYLLKYLRPSKVKRVCTQMIVTFEVS